MVSVTAKGEATISHLPAEVLLLVFKIYSMVEWRGGDVPWIKITHVCRAWRETALSAAALWSYIRLTPSTALDRVAAWLERSQRTPLTVISLFSLNVRRNPQENDINELIMRQLDRIRELEMYLPDATAIQSVDAMSNYPQLRSFACYLMLDAPHDTEFPLLPYFDTMFPNLTSLAVRNFRINIGAGQFPANLTSLILFEGNPATYATAGQVLDILRRLPLLEEFTIGKGKLLDEGVLSLASVSLSTVNLPHLRHLSIAEHIRPFIHLITHLAVPKGLHFHMNIQVTPDSMPIIASTAATSVIANWIKQVNLPWHTACFQLEAFSDEDDEGSGASDSLMFTASSVGDATALFGSHRQDLSSLTLEEAEPAMDGFWDDGYMDMLFHAFDYSSVKTLVVNADEGRPNISMTFSKFEQVETLYVVGNSMSCATDCLGFFDQRHTQEKLVFPRLKTLYLCDLYFEDYGSGESDQFYIREMLVDRARKGARLERLVIGECREVELEDFSELGNSIAVAWATEEELKVVYDRSERSVDELAVQEGIQQVSYSDDGEYE
ncbi:hypothetical protein BDY19DRAFT_907107 [Irpex rosettiformis]|uniref:Uncharacterized protein n=1 Tax=Irpex rosettiformis TaxID=378272 RepID=A0ACB8U1I7_9APHY|nr:hypothetical protein BDY19DRAFT_907107 [Irpex rosettiformis]